MNDEDERSCRTCKHFSVPYKFSKRGFCMKRRKGTGHKDICGRYAPDYLIEYKMECKTASSPW